jgi:hypothetical protein
MKSAQYQLHQRYDVFLCVGYDVLRRHVLLGMHPCAAAVGLCVAMRWSAIAARLQADEENSADNYAMAGSNPAAGVYKCGLAPCSATAGCLQPLL